MHIFRWLGAMLGAPAFLLAQGSSDPAGALSRYELARFAGSGNDSIQAMATDAAGNVYVTGTTTSLDLPVKNAAQPKLGGALLVRSLDNGATWQGIDTRLFAPVTIAPSPSDPATLFVGAQDGIYKTADGGATWRRTYQWGSAQYQEIAADPANPRLVYAIEYSPSLFLESADGGETWQKLTAPFPPFYILFSANMLWVDPNGSGTVVLGFQISRDHGATWQSMANAAPYMADGFTTPAPGSPGTIYAATAAGAAGSLSVSTDWGSTWTQKVNPDNFFLDDLLADPDQNNTLYAISTDNLYVSHDGGNIWVKSSAQVNEGNVAVLGKQCGGGLLLALGYPGPIASADSGATWQNVPLQNVTTVATGAGCAAYAIRSLQSDAFVAKLSPGGDVLWSTFLGGSGPDAAVGIAIDGGGNVYVAGNTTSTDFPVTKPGNNAQASGKLFTVKYDSSGNVVYSTVIGAQTMNLTGMSVNASGEVFLAGRTGPGQFPVTPGAFQTTPAANGNNGFAVKLASDGTLKYATYLGDVDSQYREPVGGSPYGLNGPQIPIAAAGAADGSMLVSGHANTLSRIAPDGSAMTSLFSSPGQIYAISTDENGYVYVTGQTDAAAALSQSCYYGLLFHVQTYLPAGDVYVLKLAPSTLAPVYAATLAGDCQSLPGAMQIGAGGDVTLGVWAWQSFPQMRPVLRHPPQCTGSGSAGISRLDANGKLLFSSYLDMCGFVPAIAAGASGEVFAGVEHPYPTTNGHAAVLRLQVGERPSDTK